MLENKEVVFKKKEEKCLSPVRFFLLQFLVVQTIPVRVGLSKKMTVGETSHNLTLSAS